MTATNIIRTDRSKCQKADHNYAYILGIGQCHSRHGRCCYAKHKPYGAKGIGRHHSRWIQNIGEKPGGFWPLTKDKLEQNSQQAHARDERNTRNNAAAHNRQKYA